MPVALGLLVVPGRAARCAADPAPLATPPSVTAIPMDNAVRLSWPRQPDSVLVAVGFAGQGLSQWWSGGSVPVVSGTFTGRCDQRYMLSVEPYSYTQGEFLLDWSKVPETSPPPLTGSFEVTRADSDYSILEGIRVRFSGTNTLVTQPSDFVTVVRDTAFADTVRLHGGWTGSSAPLQSGIYLRRSEPGAFVFHPRQDALVSSSAGDTLDWHFYLSSADSVVVRSGSVVIPHADTLVAARFGTYPALRVGLGAGSVNAADSFVVGVRNSVLPDSAKNEIELEGATYEGYAIWRSEVIDLSRAIYVGKMRRCSAPADSLNYLDPTLGPATLEYTDHEVHDGFPYYFAVTTSDAVIDSISPSLWNAIRIGPLYPRKVAYDSALTPSSGHSPFADASKAHVVPNPFKLSEVWDEGDSKLQFVDLPEGATVYVYTESGDFVTSIQQTDPRSDRVDWNLRNGSGRKVVSGIYMFKVESPHGEKIGRFIIIR